MSLFFASGADSWLTAGFLIGVSQKSLMNYRAWRHRCWLVSQMSFLQVFSHSFNKTFIFIHHVSLCFAIILFIKGCKAPCTTCWWLVNMGIEALFSDPFCLDPIAIQCSVEACRHIWETLLHFQQVGIELHRTRAWASSHVADNCCFHYRRVSDRRPTYRSHWLSISRFFSTSSMPNNFCDMNSVAVCRCSSVRYFDVPFLQLLLNSSSLACLCVSSIRAAWLYTYAVSLVRDSTSFDQRLWWSIAPLIGWSGFFVAKVFQGRFFEISCVVLS